MYNEIFQRVKVKRNVFIKMAHSCIHPTAWFRRCPIRGDTTFASQLNSLVVEFANLVLCGLLLRV